MVSFANENDGLYFSMLVNTSLKESWPTWSLKIMVVNARHAGHGSRWMYIAMFREQELFYTLLHSPHYYISS